MNQLSKLLLLVFLLFSGSTIAKSVREYSEEECIQMGLSPIIMENGEVFLPKDDGQHYFVYESIEAYKNLVTVTPDQIKNAVVKTKAAGKIIYDLASFHYVSSMPIVVNKAIGGIQYDLLLDKLIFTPQGNFITVQAVISFPDGKYLCFEAVDLKFTGQGGITSGSLALVLGGQNDLEILNLEKIKLAIAGGKLNFGCNGFESFGLSGRVVFDRSLIVPENPVTGAVLGGNVESTFLVDNILDWNEMIFQISIQDFQLPNMPDYGYSVKNAVIDYSESKNASALTFPQNYRSELSDQLWKGVYAQEVRLRLPKAFKKRDSRESITIIGSNIVIDNNGFSCFISAKNVLPLKSGELKGWDFSIDGAMLNIVKNKVRGAGLDGKIRFSIVKEEQAVGYKAIIDPSRQYYNFSVSNSDSLEFEFLKASRVFLDPSSKINLVYNQGEFDADAYLNGSMSIGQKNTQDTTAPVKISEIVFEKLFVSTKLPFLSAGYIGRKSAAPSKLSNFNISITQPTFVANNGEATMNMAINVNLDNAGIEATGGFFIKAKLFDESGRHFWRLTSFGVDAIRVHGDLSKFTFDGTLKFLKNNPIYGDGFYGRLSAQLKTNGNMGLEAMAMFGKSVEQKPYWMVDAQLSTGSSSAGLSIDFLAGCMYKNMSPSSRTDPFIQTLSGVTYEPNFDTGWGGRFAIAFSKGSSMSVAAGMEIQTRADGALSKIGFIGRASFAGSGTDANRNEVKSQYMKMCRDSDLSRAGGIANKLDNDPATIQNISDKFKPLDSASANKQRTTASIMVKLDFENDTYYGKFGVSFTMKGLAIQAGGAFFSAPNKWYVHIGEPPLSSRIIISAPSLPPINGYFMIGDGVAALPNPEPNIFVKYPSKKGERNADIDPGTIATGRGIALGGAVFFDKSLSLFKDFLQFKVFAQAGFDLMLIKYDDGFYCVNRPGEPLGVNNWRAMGQIYAMASFAASVKGINVLSLDAGALLRAASPNPTYATGQVAVAFRLLMKKFRFNVGFTLGEDCEVAQSNQTLENLTLIKSKFPEYGAEVSPNTIPKVNGFEEFDKDIIDPTIGDPIQLQIKKVEVKTEKGEILEGKVAIVKDELTFTPDKPFPAFQKVYLKSKAQVFLSKNGTFTPAQIEEGYVEEDISMMFIATKSDKDFKDELDAYKEKINADALAILEREKQKAKEIEEKTNQIVTALNSSADSVAAILLANCSNCSQATIDSLKNIAKQMVSGVKNATSNTDSTVKAILSVALTKVSQEVEKAKKKAFEVLEVGKTEIDELQKKAKEELDKYTDEVLSLYQGYCKNTFSWQNTPEGFIESQSACLRYKNEAVELIKEKEKQLKLSYGLKKQESVDYSKNQADQIMSQAQARCDSIMNQAAGQCQSAINELRKECESIMQAANDKCKDMKGYADKVNMDEYIHKLISAIDFSVITNPNQSPTNRCNDSSNPQILASSTTITKGQSLVLTGSGCASNTTYLWNDTFFGANLTVSPTQSGVYKLACKLINCDAKTTSITINVSENNPSSNSSQGGGNSSGNNCEGLVNPNVWASATEVIVGSEVNLSANGCASGSEYHWTDLGSTGQNISVRISSSKFYNVKCSKAGCEDKWGGVYINMKEAPVNPCSNLTVPTINGTESIIKGQSTSLGAFGCIAGSTYRWNTGEVGQNITINPNVVSTYTVTCEYESCPTQSASKNINVIDPCAGHASPNVYADNYNVYFGQTTIVHASCPNGSQLRWDTGSTASERTILINGNYVATAVCTREGCEPRSASVTINGMMPANNNDSNNTNGYNNYSNYNSQNYTNGYY